MTLGGGTDTDTMIVDWGDGATNKRIYFPQAFKSGTVTVYTTHDTNIERALADVGWVSNTAFSIGTLDNSGSIVHTGWLATGRWK